ncbi:2-phospho-L-lactate guanylyltransferase [Serinicoccus marinus]|uniref:2-phospho-L-lactate guanylyltransferase n=1 Tax=Serinicoccus marinus TaxID=247333 RepID=UPI0003B35C78|nr:2-phospho-L-lactate guanylyltransferase [Serinicoccus marinus]
MRDRTGRAAAGLDWRLVLPVQRADRAKTRLVAPDGVSRPELARAIALDTLDAVCRALPPGRVTVVTADDGAADRAREVGARAVPDPGRGLDEAIRRGLDDAALQVGGESGAGRQAPGWAVLLGDLPALRPEDLREALARCAALDRAVVPDAEGTGTVLLTSTRGIPRPRFGAGSAARHAVDATRLDLDLPRLRRDVDRAEDLQEALLLGVGARTRAALGSTAA